MSPAMALIALISSEAAAEAAQGGFGSAAWAAGTAVTINRVLQLLKRSDMLMPAKMRPHLPLVAAALGVAAGLLQAFGGGASWTEAATTALAGAGGAVWIEEGGRSAGAIGKARKSSKAERSDA